MELSNIGVEWQEGARQIDDCKYLFVHGIREIEELTLSVIVTEPNPPVPGQDAAVRSFELITAALPARVPEPCGRCDLHPTSAD